MDKVTRIGRGAGGRLQNADGTWNGGRKGRGEKLLQLQEENAALKRRLLMTEPMTETLWERTGTQAIRDEMAARAYMQCWGHPVWTLTQLGFGQIDAHSQSIQQRILASPGFCAIMEQAMAPVIEQKSEIIARVAKVARFGDDDAAVRAVGQLGKLEGWIKPDAGATVNVSLYSLFGGAAEKNVTAIEQKRQEGDVLAILSHEPGPAKRIDSGDEAVSQAIGDDEP